MRSKYAHGTEFQIGKIEMVANTGTYIDSPFHRYENGKDLSELPLESVANLECIVVRIDPGVTAMTPFPWKRVVCRDARFCFTPVGIATGDRTLTSRTIRI